MNMLQNKAMLVSLSLGVFDPIKTDKNATHKVLHDFQAAPGSGKFKKRLLPEEAVNAIKKLDNSMRGRHAAMTLPWDMDGVRILSMGLFEEYRKEVSEFKSKRELLITEFLDHYADHRDLQVRRLSGLGNLSEYPPVERVREKFYTQINWQPLPDKGDFRCELQEDALREIEEQVERRMAEAEVRSRNELYSRLGQRLTYLADRLRDADATFRDSLIEGTRELCRLIPGLNITGDPVIEELRIEVLKKIAEHDPETLRSDTAVRESAVSAADDILRRMGLKPAAQAAA